MLHPVTEPANLGGVFTCSSEADRGEGGPQAAEHHLFQLERHDIKNMRTELFRFVLENL